MTPPAGAQSRLWRLVATANAGGGYATSAGLQVTVGPLVSARLSSSTQLARTGTSVGVTLTLHNASDHQVTTTTQISPVAGLTITPTQVTVVLQPRATQPRHSPSPSDPMPTRSPWI